MPKVTFTTYLEEAYNILEENINSTNPYKRIEGNIKKAEDINFEAVWKDIHGKANEFTLNAKQNKLVAFHNAFKSELAHFKNKASSSNYLKGFNEKENLTKLLINPQYKGIVANLTKIINADKQASNEANQAVVEYDTAVQISEETVALNRIKQQLQEFIQLSRLASYSISYSGFRELIKYRDELEILGAMNKLQFCLVMDSIKEFLSSFEEENQEINSIIKSIIKYLDQAALTNKIYNATALGFKRYGTNLEAIKISLTEDKESLQNAFEIYLNNLKTDDDKFYDAEEKYDAALYTLEEDDDDAEFVDALEEPIYFSVSNQQESNPTSHSNPTTNLPKKDKNLNNLEKIILFIGMFYYFPIIDQAIFIVKTLDSLIDKIKKNTEKRTPPSTHIRDRQTHPSLINNSCIFFRNDNGTDELIDPLSHHIKR